MRRAGVLLLVFALSGCELLDDLDGGGDSPAPENGTEPGQGEPGQEPGRGGETAEGEEGKAGEEGEGGGHVLDERWRPLERIVERPPLPGLSSSVATTVGTEIYVQDLEAWLAERPPGSPRYEALLSHEQVHAKRQQAAGVNAWIQRYLRDRDFMWAEEQLGYYEQLRYYEQHGMPVDVEGTVQTLTGYRNLAGAMVDEAEARAWVEAVLAGKWKPSG